MHEIQTERTFVVRNEDGETYKLEVYADRSYITRILDNGEEETFIQFDNVGLAEMFEAMAVFVRQETKGS